MSTSGIRVGSPPSALSHRRWRMEIALPGLVGVALVLLLTTLPVAAASLEERLAPCLACHGENGQSQTPEVPSLGAQPAFYLTVQLVMFRERLRLVEPMNAMTQGLTDDELRQMADLIAKLPPPRPVEQPGDPIRLEQARALIQQHRCAFCHNPDFSGAQQVPRLAAQREDYLLKALRDYKSNARRAYDPAMADVLYALSDGQLADLAYFLARAP